jgi:hypothetical protein
MKTFSINRISIAALFMFIAAFLFSCQKENSSSQAPVTEEQAVVYSEESSEAEGSLDDAEDVAMTAADEESAEAGTALGGRYLPRFEELRKRIGQCAEVTVTPNDSTYPKTVTIDFGAGCTGPDGKFRKGKMVLHFTGPLRKPGSVVTLTFVDFYVNRAHIEGVKIFTNQSELPVHKWNITIVDGKVSFPNGRGYKYEGTKTVKQIEGMDTRTVRDDVYKIVGRSKTEYNNGTVITIITVDPLIKKVACNWKSEGTLKIQINEREFKLDFGFPNNGDCDNKALLTWDNGNKQRVILLP